MALQTQSLTAAEHDYYLANSNVTTSSAFSDHKRDVLCGQIGNDPTNPQKSTYELEIEAIRKYGNVSVNTPPYDAWVAAMQTNGSTAIPPGASLNHIKWLFYISGGFV